MSAPAAARQPVATPLVGRTVRLAPTDPRDADALFEAAQRGDAEALWRYMADAPDHDLDGYRRHLAALAARTDVIALSIFEPGAPTVAQGYACYMRIAPSHACIEIGNVLFTPALRRTTAATEALFLLLAHAFDDLGFRRVEWKCDNRNAASQAAALRLGFAFEGLFRQHMIVRGQTRDTAWFALLDRDWPLCRAALARWLAPDNYEGDGRQRHTLAAIRRSLGAG